MNRGRWSDMGGWAGGGVSVVIIVVKREEEKEGRENK